MAIFSTKVNASDMTGECWLIQLEGKDACGRCPYLATPDCGGKSIIKTGKNSKGHKVPLVEMV